MHFLALALAQAAHVSKESDCDPLPQTAMYKYLVYCAVPVMYSILYVCVHVFSTNHRP